MSRIGSKNTKPEIIVRKFLHKEGYRFSLHNKRLPGKPDIILTKHKTVIFINGCFWHGHDNCKYFVMPHAKNDYWFPKIVGNIFRDFQNINQLKNLGWKYIVIWECDLKKLKIEKSLSNLKAKLRKHM